MTGTDGARRRPDSHRGPEIDEACAAVREGIARATIRMRADDLPVPDPRGKLLRPLVAWAVLPPRLRGQVDDRFWLGALAIQMVHEASLVHDDIIDEAATRRGRPSLVADRGVGAAVVLGDHLLTAAYRVAAAAAIPGFLDVFVRAVERTVAGEIAQHRSVGRSLTPEYRAAIEGKSGELFGAAVALAHRWADAAEHAPGEVEGRRIGALYQMVDDALDYCPAADVGKPALQDYRQRKWTFVLRAAGLDGFALSDDDVVGRLFDPARGDAGVRVIATLDEERRSVLDAVAPADGLLAAVLDEWVDMARDAYAAQRREFEDARVRARPTARSVEAEVVEMAGSVGGAAAWGRYFGRHSKSFRFSARLFPGDARRSVEGVYAFCRFTDDLVDEAEVDAHHARARLEAFRRGLVTAAYQGTATGVPLADVVMGEAARRGVPLHYADDLLTGVGMDLEPLCFDDLDALEVYTYRVASVVGWITELFGVRDPEVLNRAHALGHAMQLTNILRDVGEDWRDDRLYLPRGLLERHGLGPADVDRVASGRGPVADAWKALCEDLMAVADRHYDRAFLALPALPPFYARPVAVAARVYQGIHDAIRANDYDNGTRRAYTRLTTKLRLGVGGLIDLRRTRAPESNERELRASPQDG